MSWEADIKSVGAAHFCLQQSDQTFIHKLVFIRNVQADYPSGFQICSIFLLKFVAMGLLHHENKVSPADKLGRQRIVRVGISAGGRHFDSGMIGKNLLRGRAA